MTRYGITEDYDYNQTHKRKRIMIWSGPFSLDFEGEGYSLPKGDGYMLNLGYGGKVRVECPVERTDANYMEQDKAINDAINAYYGKPEAAKPVVASSPVEVAREFVRSYVPTYKPNGKKILVRR